MCSEFYGAVTLASGHGTVPGNRRLLRLDQTARLKSLARETEPRGRKIVTVTADDHTFQLDIDGQTVGTVPRTSGREIHRYKVYATQQPRSPR